MNRLISDNLCEQTQIVEQVRRMPERIPMVDEMEEETEEELEEEWRLIKLFCFSFQN